MNADTKPAVSYWHLWSDEHGISHQSRCQLTEFEKAPIQPGAAPQWIGSKTRGNATVFVTVLPPGWVGDWHKNPKPQWIIPSRESGTRVHRSVSRDAEEYALRASCTLNAKGNAGRAWLR